MLKASPPLILLLLFGACGSSKDLHQAEIFRSQGDYSRARASYGKLKAKQFLQFSKKTFLTYRQIEAEFNLGIFKPYQAEALGGNDDAPSLETLRLFLLAVYQLKQGEKDKALASFRQAPGKSELLSYIKANEKLLQNSWAVDAEIQAYFDKLDSVFIPVLYLAEQAVSKPRSKPVFLNFGAGWCPDCRVMKSLLNQPAVHNYVKAHFEAYTIDVGRFDRNLPLVYRFDVRVIAKLTILSKEGEVLSNQVFEPATGSEKGLSAEGVLAHLKRFVNR